MAKDTKSLTVKAAQAGVRIDKFLASVKRLGLSRSKIEKLIDQNLVLVNGSAIISKYIVCAGDKIAITIPPAPPSNLVAEDLAVEIVFEDEHLAVVNKPAGMVTHPAAGNLTGTLVNALLHHFGKLPAGSGLDRPGIVHRLDKNTSGLLVVAKTEEAFAALQKADCGAEDHAHLLGDYLRASERRRRND